MLPYIVLFCWLWFIGSVLMGQNSSGLFETLFKGLLLLGASILIVFCVVGSVMWAQATGI